MVAGRPLDRVRYTRSGKSRCLRHQRAGWKTASIDVGAVGRDPAGLVARWAVDLFQLQPQRPDAGLEGGYGGGRRAAGNAAERRGGSGSGTPRRDAHTHLDGAGTMASTSTGAERRGTTRCSSSASPHARGAPCSALRLRRCGLLPGSTYRRMADICCKRASTNR